MIVAVNEIKLLCNFMDKKTKKRGVNMRKSIGLVEELKEFKNLSQLEANILGLDEMDEKEVIVDNKEQKKFKAIYNMNKNRVEAILTKKYKLVQYKEAFLPFVDTLRTIQMDVEGKIFSNGKRVFVVTYFKDERAMININGDELRLGVVLENSVNGTSAVKGELSALRMVCSNGMVVGDVVGKIRQIHLGNNKETMMEFYKSFIKEMMNNSTRLKDIILQAMTDKIGQGLIEQVYAGCHFGDRQIKQLIEGLKVQDEINGWDLYNRVTDWISHELNCSFARKMNLQRQANKLLTVKLETLSKEGNKIMGEKAYDKYV